MVDGRSIKLFTTAVIFILFKSTEVNKYEIIQADSLKKTEDMSQFHQRFSRKMMSEKRVQKSVLLMMTHYYPDLGTASDWLCCVISMEFLHSFLTCHFAGKLLVALQNVVCFLRLPGQ